MVACVGLVQLARNLRTRSTQAETCLWEHLRNRKLASYKFKRQVPIENYIVDFLCISKKIIIELDGYHHKNLAELDIARTKKLTELGFTVVRFWNDEVLNDTAKVLGVIQEHLDSHSNT